MEYVATRNNSKIGQKFLEGFAVLACLTMMGTSAIAQGLNLGVNLGGAGVNVSIGGGGGSGGGTANVGVNLGTGDAGGGVAANVGVDLGTGGAGGTGGGVDINVGVGGGAGGGDGTGYAVVPGTSRGYASNGAGGGCNIVGNTSAFDGFRAVDQDGVIVGDILGVMINEGANIISVRFMTVGNLFDGRRCIDIAGENIWADGAGIHLPISQAMLIAQLASN